MLVTIIRPPEDCLKSKSEFPLLVESRFVREKDSRPEFARLLVCHADQGRTLVDLQISAAFILFHSFLGIRFCGHLKIGPDTMPGPVEVIQPLLEQELPGRQS